MGRVHLSATKEGTKRRFSSQSAAAKTVLATAVFTTRYFIKICG
jgi:hypothetical protein